MAVLGIYNEARWIIAPSVLCSCALWSFLWGGPTLPDLTEKRQQGSGRQGRLSPLTFSQLCLSLAWHTAEGAMVNALWVPSFEACTVDVVTAPCLMASPPLPAGLSTACATTDVPSAIENYSEGTTFFTSTPLPEAVRMQSEHLPAAAHPDHCCGRGMHCRQHSRLHTGACQCLLLPSSSSGVHAPCLAKSQIH